MVQYQSFPDAAGDSRTSDKLKALNLPPLEGKSFLDIGCNEGYFCGYAHFMGAERSVGVDHTAEFIYRAQMRFPRCEFHVRDWNQLPDGQFDVILLASALHYAEDQPALIRRLVDKLTPDGVLVLELGIVSSPRAEWVKVKRGDDERYFPSMAQLKQTLVDYAWKWIGASVTQSGDPVARHVVHISHRRPVAYLLMQPPAYGKSSLAARLFPPAKVPIISGDQIIQLIADKKLPVSAQLQAVVDQEYTPFTIDKSIQRIFESKLDGELVDIWMAKAGKQDFAFDGFVPVDHHSDVERHMAEAGYMPVLLRWERVAANLPSEQAVAESARAYNRSLVEAGAPPAIVANRAASSKHEAGYVDEVRVVDGQVVVRGWAFDESGNAPAQLVVGVGTERTFVDVGTPQGRVDVQRHHKLAHANVGYTVTLPVAGLTSMAELGKRGFSVVLPSGAPLRLAQAVSKGLADRSTD